MPEFIVEFFEYILVIIGPKFEFRLSKRTILRKKSMVHKAIRKENRRTKK